MRREDVSRLQNTTVPALEGAQIASAAHKNAVDWHSRTTPMCYPKCTSICA